jgi:enoyl-CoA hydratase/carnithine racemase
MYATRPSFHFNSAISRSETTFPQTRRTHWQPHPLRHLKYAGAPGTRSSAPLAADDKPIIARVNGHAVGLGATVALLCDIIIVADHAKIGDPHVNAGLVVTGAR